MNISTIDLNTQFFSLGHADLTVGLNLLKKYVFKSLYYPVSTNWALSLTLKELCFVFYFPSINITLFFLTLAHTYTTKALNLFSQINISAVSSRSGCWLRVPSLWWRSVILTLPSWISPCISYTNLAIWTLNKHGHIEYSSLIVVFTPK